MLSVVACLPNSKHIFHSKNNNDCSAAMQAYYSQLRFFGVRSISSLAQHSRGVSVTKKNTKYTSQVSFLKSKKKYVGAVSTSVKKRSPFDFTPQAKSFIKKITSKKRSLALYNRRQLIKAADKLASLKTGRVHTNRSIKPFVDRTHPFKNKRGPLMTKRNKRLSFFFRAVRSLSSQLFSGYRAKELKSRRRRRHFKFFASVNQLGFSTEWRRRAAYSIKNERVRWGYNLAKFKKKRMFYYKLSSRIFFRRFFGFSNHTKVSNFQNPFRKSPIGYLKFFNMYKHKPYSLVKSLRWLKSYFSFYNMQAAKYLTFISYNNTNSLFRSSAFWTKNTRANKENNRFDAQSLFLLTQPISRTAQYSELDFFKKKMASKIRVSGTKSRWLNIKKQNFFNSRKQTQRYKTKNQITQRGVRNHYNRQVGTFVNKHGIAKNVTSINLKGRTSLGVTRNQQIYFKKRKRSAAMAIASSGSNKFFFFFRNIVYKKKIFALAKMPRHYKRTKRNKSMFSTRNGRFYLLNAVFRKLLLIRGVGLQSRLSSIFTKIKKNTDVRSLLFKKSKSRFFGKNPLKLVTLRSNTTVKATKLVVKKNSMRIRRKSSFKQKKISNFSSGYSLYKNFFLASQQGLSGVKNSIRFLKRLSFLKKRHRAVFSSAVSSFNNRKTFIELEHVAVPSVPQKILAFSGVPTTAKGSGRFARRLKFAANLTDAVGSRKLLLSSKVLKVFNVDKSYLLNHRSISTVEETFSDLGSCKSELSKRMRKKSSFRINRILYRFGLSNVFYLFRASTPLNMKIFKLLNDSRDTTLPTLKFLYRIRGIVEDIHENPADFQYSNLSYSKKSDNKQLLLQSKKKSIATPVQKPGRLSTLTASNNRQVLNSLDSVQKKRLATFSKLGYKHKFFFRDVTGFSDNLFFKKRRRAISPGRNLVSMPISKVFGQRFTIKKKVRPYKMLSKKLSIIKRFWWRKWSKVLSTQPIDYSSRLKKPQTKHLLPKIISTGLKNLALPGKIFRPKSAQQHFYKKGWVYDVESHSYMRRNKIKADISRINPSTSVFTFRTYKNFLKQQKLDYLKKKIYGFSFKNESSNHVFTPLLRIREHSGFVNILKGMILPFWLNLVRSASSHAIYSDSSISLWNNSNRSIFLGSVLELSFFLSVLLSLNGNSNSVETTVKSASSLPVKKLVETKSLILKSTYKKNIRFFGVGELMRLFGSLLLFSKCN